MLCTAKETYAIKQVRPCTYLHVCLLLLSHRTHTAQVETSNALLLLDSDPGTSAVTGSAEIKALVKSNLELQRIRPNLDPLKELLRQELFDLELDEDAERSKYERSTEALFNKLQASKTELLAGLTRLEAVQHRGQWWLLHPRTTEVILREILNIRLQFKYVSPVTH